jgi:acetylornithine/succinyldiaminopimelate/putrescine aminotransferase
MIDFTSSGIFAAILGPNPPAIRKAMNKVDVIASYAAHYPSKWTLRYIDMLKEFTGYESVALFSTGSEATEAYWRCMRVHTGKFPIWGGLVDPDNIGKDLDAAPDAMHGWTMGAMIMAGKLNDVYGFRYGQPPEATCGMIMEPYHAPSAQFHRQDPTINRIMAIRKEFPDITLCCDEVQAGFGRTGQLFGWEWYGEDFKPEFVTIGKACGAGLPLSALLGPAEIMESEAVKEFANLHSTHSGHPIMCAAGCAVIEEIQKHDLISRSYNLGKALEYELDYIGVRHHAGRGLLAGLEFKDAEQAHLVAELCEQKGLLVVDTHRKWIKIGPALNITQDDLANGCRILKNAVEEVLNARDI